LDPKEIIDRARKLKKKTTGALTLEQIQEAIDQGRPWL